MANALKTLFTDIADAIREKSGNTDTIVPANFPAEILAISGGGDQPQLNKVSIAKNGDTLTITNPSSNGGYVSTFKAKFHPRLPVK